MSKASQREVSAIAQGRSDGRKLMKYLRGIGVVSANKPPLKRDIKMCRSYMKHFKAVWMKGSRLSRYYNYGWYSEIYH